MSFLFGLMHHHISDNFELGMFLCFTHQPCPIPFSLSPCEPRLFWQNQLAELIFKEKNPQQNWPRGHFEATQKAIFFPTKKPILSHLLIPLTTSPIKEFKNNSDNNTPLGAKLGLCRKTIYSKLSTPRSQFGPNFKFRSRQLILSTKICRSFKT